MAKWKKTTFSGVRYREHKSKKHGVNFDRYFAIYYWFNDKRYEEAIGWASKGWSAKKANQILAELQDNQKRGVRPFSLKERRELQKKEEEAAEQKIKEEVTFREYFQKHYIPDQNTVSYSNPMGD